MKSKIFLTYFGIFLCFKFIFVIQMMHYRLWNKCKISSSPINFSANFDFLNYHLLNYLNFVIIKLFQFSINPKFLFQFRNYKNSQPLQFSTNVKLIFLNFTTIVIFFFFLIFPLYVNFTAFPISFTTKISNIKISIFTTFNVPSKHGLWSAARHTKKCWTTINGRRRL